MPAAKTRKQPIGKLKRAYRRVLNHKNNAPMPITAGKAGSLKRAVYEAGGGKKVLKRLRNAPKAVRKSIAGAGKANTLSNLRGVSKNYSGQALKARAKKVGTRSTFTPARKPAKGGASTGGVTKRRT